MATAVRPTMGFIVALENLWVTSLWLCTLFFFTVSAIDEYYYLEIKLKSTKYNQSMKIPEKMLTLSPRQRLKLLLL